MPNLYSPYHKVLSVTPTIDAVTTYADNDSVGGLMSFAGAVRSNDLVDSAGVIRSVVISDKGAQLSTDPIELIFFDSNPTASTFTDNLALDVDDADLPKVCGFVATVIAAAVGVAAGTLPLADNEVAFLHDLYIPYALGTGTILYAAMRATGTQDNPGITDLTVRLGLQLD